MRLIVWPDATYAALVRAPQTPGAALALRRPFLVLVVLGASMALSSTRHVTPALVISSMLVWSVVVIAQAAIAWVVIPRTARVGSARAFDLFFASHAPWSLWILFYAAWAPSALGRPVMPVWLAAVVPLMLTPRIIAAFYSEVCGMDRRRAAVRTLAHQAISWSLFIVLYGAAVAIWPRILQELQ